MVLEQIFKIEFLQKKPWFAFLMGFLYSFISIISSSILFGKGIGYMSVAFTSLLLLPSLNALLQKEANQELKNNTFTIRQLFQDHKDIIKIYLFIFFGVFCTFFEVGLIMSSGLSETLLSPQLNVAGITGYGFNKIAFLEIVSNNLIVLLVCFILSLAYGAGSILFLAWNASVWGAIIGYLAREAILVTGQNPFIYLINNILPLLPHLLAESTAYFSAAVIGGIISKAVLREKLFSSKFNKIMKDAVFSFCIGMAFVVIGALIEVLV